MLKRPRLGAKNITNVRILLTAAHSVHMNTVIFGLNVRNPFSATNAFTCFNTAEVILMMIEAVRMLVGLAFMPRNESFLKKLSRPPVVGVSVDASKSRMICMGIW